MQTGTSVQCEGQHHQEEEEEEEEMEKEEEEEDGCGGRSSPVGLVLKWVAS